MEECAECDKSLDSGNEATRATIWCIGRRVLVDHNPYYFCSKEHADQWVVENSDEVDFQPLDEVPQ